MTCPKCKRPLERAGRTLKCEQCDGAWVEAEVLVPLLEQSASALVELPWQPNTEDHSWACPQCSAAMQTVKLGTVALDRCEPHGVWFDAKELAALLGQAKKFRSHTHEEIHIGLLERLAGIFK